MPHVVSDELLNGDRVLFWHFLAAASLYGSNQPLHVLNQDVVSSYQNLFALFVLLIILSTILFLRLCHLPLLCRLRSLRLLRLHILIFVGNSGLRSFLHLLGLQLLFFLISIQMLRLQFVWLL